MAVRFPRPAFDEMYHGHGSYRVEQINDLVWNASGAFRIVQPMVEDGCDEHDVADLDTGTDGGWRVGTMYTGLDKAGEIESRHYAVYLEDEGSRVSRDW